jgi:hypothetical protein
MLGAQVVPDCASLVQATTSGLRWLEQMFASEQRLPHRSRQCGRFLTLREPDALGSGVSGKAKPSKTKILKRSHTFIKILLIQ